MKHHLKLNDSYEFTAENNDQFLIRKCQRDDILQVHYLEHKIDPDNPASVKVLKSRLDIFNDGFLIVTNTNGTVVGYIHSILLNDFHFTCFEEISNFSEHFNNNGNTLYINFLGVSDNYRNLGIALFLLQHIEMIAKYYNVIKLKLVSKHNVQNLYKKFGFKSIMALPEFIKNKKYPGVLMEKRLI